MFYPLPQSGRVLAVFGCYYLIYLRWGGGGEFNLSPASSLPNTSYIEKHETQPINSWFNWIKNSILYSEFKKQNFIFFIIIFYRIPYKILNFKGSRFTIGQQCIFTYLCIMHKPTVFYLLKKFCASTKFEDQDRK